MTRLPSPRRPGAALVRQRGLGERVLLPDGAAVRIRPIRTTDAALLADGFARLSTRSRQLRFLTAKRELTPRELRYLTDVDHHDHEALVALHDGDGRGLGVARYVRRTDEAEAAEIAVTVVDEWQGRRLGAALLAALTRRARDAGLRRFVATVSAENAAAIALLRSLGRPVRLLGREGHTLDYEITLPVQDADLEPARPDALRPCA